MSSVNHKWNNQDIEFDYLCVDEFIESALYAQALATAFKIGLIDLFLKKHEEFTFDSLAKQLGTNSRGMRLLLDLLLSKRVVINLNGRLKLTGEFVHALQYRDLLELKLGITNIAAHDFLDYFTDLVCSPEQFMKKVRFCRLFSYDKCFNHSKENYELTKRWMQITTILTKYEARVCIRYHDFSRYQHVLDIGGNSGEFMLQVCRKYPEILAAVFDLPLVCEIGQQHIQSEPESNRISFIKGNALTDVLPGGFDLIVFKSMLHDWPEKEADQFIFKASQSLSPGGTLLIFERGPLEGGEAQLSYATIPMLLFFHSFRPSVFYEKILGNYGFQGITIKKLFLDTPFHLIAAQKAA